MEKKHIRSLMNILLVIVIPGYVRIFFSNAFVLVRDVDIVLMLITGILTGILIMVAKNYFKMKKDGMDRWE